MYIQAISVNADYRCLKKGLVIETQPITLLVGDQGSGKSTILQGLSQLGKSQQCFLDLELTPEGEKGVDTFYFDAERDNPRIKDPNLYSALDGTDRGIGYGMALSSRFRSHGEVIESFTVEPVKNAKNCIVMIDEPESGLSIRNQFKLSNAIQHATTNKTQFIIATHCFPLIQSVDQVFSMEHGQWMNSQDFINTQM